jgi:hypothetical protein
MEARFWRMASRRDSSSRVTAMMRDSRLAGGVLGADLGFGLVGLWSERGS